MADHRACRSGSSGSVGSDPSGAPTRTPLNVDEGQFVADPERARKTSKEQAQSGSRSATACPGEHMEADDLPGSMLPEANGEPDPAVIDDADAEELTNADDTVDSTPDKVTPTTSGSTMSRSWTRRSVEPMRRRMRSPSPIVRKHSTSPVRKAGGARAKAGKADSGQEGPQAPAPLHSPSSRWASSRRSCGPPASRSASISLSSLFSCCSSWPSWPDWTSRTHPAPAVAVRLILGGRQT